MRSPWPSRYFVYVLYVAIRRVRLMLRCGCSEYPDTVTDTFTTPVFRKLLRENSLAKSLLI